MDGAESRWTELAQDWGRNETSQPQPAITHAEMLASPAWHASLAQFARATGLAVTLYDTRGVVRAGPFTPTPLGLCLATAGAWKEPDGVCIVSDRSAVRTCLEKGTALHQTGLNVLSTFAVPARLAGEIIGVTVAGWGFDSFPDPVAVDRLAKAIGASYPDIWQVVRQQQPVSPEKLGIYAELLGTLCDLFLRERAEMIQEQEQARSLRTLYQSAQRLAAAETTEAIGEAVVDAVIGLSNVRCARLLVTDEEGVWRVASSVGFQDEHDGDRRASYPRVITSTIRVPVEAPDGSLLGILEASDAERFTEPKKRTQISALAAQAAVALHKTRLIADLRRERASLQRANRVKDEFLATLSHELRTPLTPILSWATILAETPPEDTELFSSGIEAIERNARQELNLVEEMLDLTRIINDKIVLHPVLMDPADVVRSIWDLARTLAEPQKQELRMEIEPQLPPISADEKRLRQVLTNLVSNAVKFTPAGGEITIGARHCGEAVEIFVRDNGIGIHADILPYIFDRFRQADSSTTRQHGGLGIGLSVARGLVELHGGRIRAESDGDGCGAIFVVSLPTATVATMSRPAPKPLASSSQEADGHDRIRHGKVLIVDDAIDTLISTRMLIERTGYEVATANSVAAAIETAHVFRPAVIVSDLGMPDQDGYDLLRIVRNDPALASVPVIALTGFATMHDREAALSAGFAAHLPKPVELGVLLAVIDRLMEERQLVFPS